MEVPGVGGDDAIPESWEMADLELSMKKLMPTGTRCAENGSPSEAMFRSDEGGNSLKSGDLNAAILQVDEFLREALQNPRDRLNILRLEREVERFLRNPKQQQLEFQPMPSSYLRLAAHRVAQHYFLQSSVVDCNSAETCRIVARKTGEMKYPAIRLADIPVSSQENARCSFSIKQRNSYGSMTLEGISSKPGSAHANRPKTVEERNEEYNKARARIFSNDPGSKQLEDFVVLEDLGQKDLFLSEVNKGRLEENRKDLKDYKHTTSSTVASKKDSENVIAKRTESVNKLKQNQKVAIIRDREKEKRDPDYDRNYDRYSQRFDPGFGVVQGPFGLQARYAPVVNYNTEFPQLGCPRGPLPTHLPMQQQMHASWGHGASASFHAQDAIMGAFGAGHGNGAFGAGQGNPHPAMTMYMHAPQYPYHGAQIAYAYSTDHLQQSQVSQQSEASSAQARHQ